MELTIEHLSKQYRHLVCSDLVLVSRRHTMDISVIGAIIECVGWNRACCEYPE